jgi:hypothetical protein
MFENTVFWKTFGPKKDEIRQKFRILPEQEVKGKGKVVPVLNKHIIKTYWGVEVQLHVFFDLTSRWM